MDQIKLKIEYSDSVKTEIKAIIEEYRVNYALLTTNRLVADMDKNNSSEYKAIRNIKMIFELTNNSLLILIGNISCNYQKSINFFGGTFYVTNGFIINGGYNKAIKGVPVEIIFTPLPDDNATTQAFLKNLANHRNFRFNINQFSDFMEIFDYYKQISSELNNNAAFEIKSMTKPYYFVSVGVKDIYNRGELLEEYQTLEPILDSNGILKGYIIPIHTYELLTNQMKDNIEILVDIKLEYSEFKFKKIIKMNENLYVSNIREISSKTADNLVEVSLINITKNKEEISLSVIMDEPQNYKYLNLYDMGQKIKIDSIEESLKLINQGATSSAIEMIEYLIGDVPMPNYGGTGVKESQRKYLKDLNESQKMAFLKAVDGSPVTLIKGPPGTGKTHVINAITQYITKELNENVVIASQTHTAIDNVLDKLMQNYDLVIPRRITNRPNKYSEKEIDYTLYKTWVSNFEKHNDRSTQNKLKRNIMKDIENYKGLEKFKFSESIQTDQYSVIGATTTTSAISGKKGLELLKNYKWLIIDEVSKSPITEVLRYLPYVDKIIMVGDDYQLAPILEFSVEDVKDLPSYNEEKFQQLESVYVKSVFADTINKAESANRLVILKENYRSVKNILSIYNKFYDNTLGNFRETVNPKKVKFDKKLDYMNNYDSFFVEVLGGKEIFDSKSKSRYNVEEILATSLCLKDLIENTINPENVTIAAIFPYASQIQKFTKENLELINKAKIVFKSFSVDTVDAFQGKESDIVLVNTVVTDASLKNFLSDFRRINVSVSRAKDKLIIFGNSTTLSKIEMKLPNGTSKNFFRDIIIEIRTTGKYLQFDNRKGLEHEDTNKIKIKIK